MFLKTQSSKNLQKIEHREGHIRNVNPNCPEMGVLSRQIECDQELVACQLHQGKPIKISS